MSTSLHLQTSTGWLHMSMLWGVNDGKYTWMVKRMVISFNHKQHDRGAHIGACWSLCQVGTRLTLDGSSTHWYVFLQLHESWAPTLHRCLQKEGKNAIKVAPHFYLGAKTEKIATDWLRGCEKTVRHCHLSSLGLLLLNTVTSWAKNKTKQRSELSESSQREEGKRRGGGKSGRNGALLPSFTLMFGVETPRSDKVGRHVWLSSWLCLPRAVAEPKNHSGSVQLPV